MNLQGYQGLMVSSIMVQQAWKNLHAWFMHSNYDNKNYFCICHATYIYDIIEVFESSGRLFFTPLSGKNWLAGLTFQQNWVISAPAQILFTGAANL